MQQKTGALAPTTRRRSMADEWASYRELVLPADAGPIQVRETEQAFYAGARAFMGVAMGVLDPGPEATPADEQHFTALVEEVDAFCRRRAEEASRG